MDRQSAVLLRRLNSDCAKALEEGDGTMLEFDREGKL